LDESVEYDGLVLAIDGDWLDFLKPHQMIHKSLFAPLLMDSGHLFFVAICEDLRVCVSKAPKFVFAKKEVACARTSFDDKCFHVRKLLIFLLCNFLVVICI
jgi:hypothetical protein